MSVSGFGEGEERRRLTPNAPGRVVGEVVVVVGPGKERDRLQAAVDVLERAHVDHDGAEALAGRSRSFSGDDDEMGEAEQRLDAARRSSPSSSAYPAATLSLVVLAASGPRRWQLPLQRGLRVVPTHQPSAWQPAGASTPAPRRGGRSFFVAQKVATRARR